MRNREDRNLARAANLAAYGAARDARATTRGNVDSINEDGSANVILPNGGTTKVAASSLFQFAPGQSIVLWRTSNNYEAMGPSAYGGGKGALFTSP